MEYEIVTLRQRSDLKEQVAHWFCEKWNIPMEAYLECINDYIQHKTEHGWYICLVQNQIVAGLGVIDNDFHERKDLTPNICAVYTEKEYRNQGIAGKLLEYAVMDCRRKGIEPLYLLTDHIGFYEQYGWEFLCMVKSDDEGLSRMYIHK